jgi:hypothetical protein
MQYRATFLMAKARGTDALNLLSFSFKFVGSPGQCLDAFISQR